MSKLTASMTHVLKICSDEAWHIFSDFGPHTQGQTTHVLVRDGLLDVMEIKGKPRAWTISEAGKKALISGRRPKVSAA